MYNNTGENFIMGTEGLLFCSCFQLNGLICIDVLTPNLTINK